MKIIIFFKKFKIIFQIQNIENSRLKANVFNHNKYLVQYIRYSNYVCSLEKLGSFRLSNLKYFSSPKNLCLTAKSRK